jgi:hypothetical protein
MIMRPVSMVIFNVFLQQPVKMVLIKNYYMIEQFPSTTTDQSVRSPLKPEINPTFRGIVVQVRIFVLKRAKMPFSA